MVQIDLEWKEKIQQGFGGWLLVGGNNLVFGGIPICFAGGMNEVKVCEILAID